MFGSSSSETGVKRGMYVFYAMNNDCLPSEWRNALVNVLTFLFSGDQAVLLKAR